MYFQVHYTEFWSGRQNGFNFTLNIEFMKMKKQSELSPPYFSAILFNEKRGTLHI
jgi:hypothetical protein